jgi:limonene-1,2-epoxide hydrolase
VHVSTEDSGKIVSEFVASWTTDDIDLMLSYFHDDAVYHNIPMAPAVGTAAIGELLKQFLLGMEDFRAEVHHQVSAGDIVMQERTDHFVADGQQRHLPICGVFELQDGKIKSWREYFDLSPFAGGSS